MIALVKKAQETHRLLVFVFHGVGGGHNINVGLPQHSQLLHYLKEHTDEMQVASMVDVATYIRGRINRLLESNGGCGQRSGSPENQARKKNFPETCNLSHLFCSNLNERKDIFLDRNNKNYLVPNYLTKKSCCWSRKAI